MDTYYEGVCGAEVISHENGGVQLVSCSRGMWMQCESGTYCIEICRGCPNAESERKF